MTRIDLYTRLGNLDKGGKPLSTAIVNPVDASSLKGAIEASRAGIIAPVLVGPVERINRVAEVEHLDLGDVPVIAADDAVQAAKQSVALARAGEVDALMKGALHTDELLRPVVARDGGLRTGRRISHSFVMDVPTYPVPLLLTDAAINIRPDLQTKRDILCNAIELYRIFDLGIPKVAIVSATEMIDPNIPSTIEAAALCKMAERGQIIGAELDGPLGFDNAVSCKAARAKGLGGPVAGKANIILVPDLEAGNIVYKQMGYLSQIASAGLVLGAKVPIILTSRAADYGVTRLASCLMAKIAVAARSS
ncbi:MAG: bifunctional enoyl-CoA hydratase/phosphate acetyltransferase [Pseudomonadota bacterium]